MRTDVVAVLVGGSGGLAQICSQRGSSECSGQNHWHPTFLTTFCAKGVECRMALAMRDAKAT